MPMESRSSNVKWRCGEDKPGSEAGATDDRPGDGLGSSFSSQASSSVELSVCRLLPPEPRGKLPGDDAKGVISIDAAANTSPRVCISTTQSGLRHHGPLLDGIISSLGVTEPLAWSIFVKHCFMPSYPIMSELHAVGRDAGIDGAGAHEARRGGRRQAAQEGCGFYDDTMPYWK